MSDSVSSYSAAAMFCCKPFPEGDLVPKMAPAANKAMANVAAAENGDARHSDSLFRRFFFLDSSLNVLSKIFEIIFGYRKRILFAEVFQYVHLFFHNCHYDEKKNKRFKKSRIFIEKMSCFTTFHSSIFKKASIFCTAM